MKKILGLLLMIGLMFTACRKDEIGTSTNNGNPPGPTVKIEGTVYGLITDENDVAIEGASINLDNNIVESDENGYFIISGLASEIQGVLTIEKAGYFTAYPTFRPSETAAKYVSVQMIERTSSNWFQAASGGTATTPQGGAVNFAPNSIVDETGTPYSGQVTVYMHYLDPSDEDIARFMPGDLSAVNAQNEATILTSLGMLNVELEGASGEALNINAPATITVPVPSSLMSIAPATIPLWHFDTESGLWVEEGEATLNGGVYEGQVSHFTLWNCDIPNSYIDLTGRVVFEGNTPLVTIRVTVIADGDSRTTFTDTDGYFEGAVPDNTDLLFEILDECGDVIYDQNLGSLSTPLDLGTIFLIDNTTYVHVEGTLLDCDMNPVNSGYVLVTTDVTTRPSFLNVDNGDVSGSISVCDATEIYTTGYNLGANQKGFAETFTVADSIDIGTAQACGDTILAGVLIDIQGAPVHIGNCTLTTQDSLTTGYNFIHDFGNGNKVIYDITIIDWNGDPNDPVYAINYVWQGIGDPDYTYAFSGNNIELVRAGTDPGDFVIFKLVQGQVDETFLDGSVINHPNTDVTFTAEIQ